MRKWTCTRERDGNSRNFIQFQDANEWTDLNAGLLFEHDEWRAAFVLNKKKPPNSSPRLNEVVCLVAMLGGFVARKGDGEPGVKTIWQGLQRVTDFATGLRYARELGD